MEYGLRGNKLSGLLVTRGIDELRKTVHEGFVRFNCHRDYPFNVRALHRVYFALANRMATEFMQ